MGFGKNRAHSKPGKTSVRAYHFRIEAKAQEIKNLLESLDLGWELRNDLTRILDEDRKAQRAVKLAGGQPSHINALELKRGVAAAKLDPKFKALHSQVRQDISTRVSSGMSLFFEAKKAGRPNVNPPKPIPRKRFRSITYPQYGSAANIKNDRLLLAKLGDFKLTGWRKMRGKKKSITIKFKGGHFWAIVLCEIQEKDVVRPYALPEVKALPEAGFDPGVACVMTDSLGKRYATPKPLKKAKGKLLLAQRSVSRKFEARKKAHKESSKAARAQGLPVPDLKAVPYSNRLQGSIRKLAKAHTKIERIRDDAAKKTARKIERRYRRAAVEEHGLMFMMKNRRMAKAASDAGIGLQKKALLSALGKGRYVEAATSRPGIGGNSQTCLCGAPVPKKLSERWHSCKACGLQGPRDQVSALIIQQTAFGSLPSAAAAGLAGLEPSSKRLKIGRGASEGRRSESSAAGSPNQLRQAGAEQFARKRQTTLALRSEKPRERQELLSANGEGETGAHAGLSCPPLGP